MVDIAFLRFGLIHPNPPLILVLGDIPYLYPAQQNLFDAYFLALALLAFSDALDRPMVLSLFGAPAVAPVLFAFRYEIDPALVLFLSSLEQGKLLWEAMAAVVDHEDVYDQTNPNAPHHTQIHGRNDVDAQIDADSGNPAEPNAPGNKHNHLPNEHTHLDTNRAQLPGEAYSDR
ncbi:MAG: hypothetical protein V1754_12480 [Pseudomonadota bacterium]